MRPAAVVLTLLIAAAACTPEQTSNPSPSPSAALSASAGPAGLAADMTAQLLAKPLPTADVFDLARRLKGDDGTPKVLFEPARASPPDEAVGATHQFWVYDFSAKRNNQITATLRLMTDNAKWWVQNEVTFDAAALAKSAQFFQDRIYSTDRRLFGEEWSPGIDGDPRIDILVARLPGAAAGYFSAADEVPAWVNKFSAEREMIYVNAMAARLGTDNLHSVLAHEFCHMIQFNKRKRSAIWFEEGQAQLCEQANGFSPGFQRLFLQLPDTQLDAWTDLDDGAAQHYGVAYLFLEYLRARSGGSYWLINALMSQGVDTVQDLDKGLRASGLPGFDEVFADFAAANAFIGSNGLDPKFVYTSDIVLRESAKPTTQDRVVVGTPLRASVHPEATRYLELPRAAFSLTFTAPPSSRVIPTDPHSGSFFWWSDRMDGLDSTLTREVDLTRTESATLSFWAWFDNERDFDYGYIAVSVDGGKRWRTLPTAGTTINDPNGNNLGFGYTGRSGEGKDAVWVQQKASLTPYAGSKILLRFEQVTDGALNMPGFAIDDIEIPEIGYRDDAEADNGWDAKGFIRSSNVVRERYIVQVLHFGAKPSVERWMVQDGKLTIDVDATADRSAPYLAVSALAPRVTDPTTFEVLVTTK